MLKHSDYLSEENERARLLKLLGRIEMECRMTLKTWKKWKTDPYPEDYYKLPLKLRLEIQRRLLQP